MLECAKTKKENKAIFVRNIKFRCSMQWSEKKLYESPRETYKA